LERFRQTLRALLDEHHMAQAELARRLGLSAQAVSAWLAGNVKPSHENVSRIEDVLNVEPRGSLLEAAGYLAGDQEAPTPESLLRHDPGLDPEDRRALVRLIRMARERFRPSPEPATATYDVDLSDPGERTIWEMDVLPEEERWQHILRLRRHLGDERGREAG
jgi:transcriptional regulator with XRE-family HTH domain